MHAWMSAYIHTCLATEANWAIGSSSKGLARQMSFHNGSKFSIIVSSSQTHHRSLINPYIHACMYVYTYTAHLFDNGSKSSMAICSSQMHHRHTRGLGTMLDMLYSIYSLSCYLKSLKHQPWLHNGLKICRYAGMWVSIWYVCLHVCMHTIRHMIVSRLQYKHVQEYLCATGWGRWCVWCRDVHTNIHACLSAWFRVDIHAYTDEYVHIYLCAGLPVCKVSQFARVQGFTTMRVSMRRCRQTYLCTSCLGSCRVLCREILKMAQHVVLTSA
jgi:hypothetical protein